MLGQNPYLSLFPAVSLHSAQYFALCSLSINIKLITNLQESPLVSNLCFCLIFLVICTLPENTSDVFFIVVKYAYHTVYHFNHGKIYKSRLLSTFYEKNFTKMMTSLYEPCNYHHYYLVPILFHHLKWKCYSYEAVTPHPSSSKSLVRSNLSLSLWMCLFWPLIQMDSSNMWLFVSSSLHSTCFKVYLWYVSVLPSFLWLFCCMAIPYFVYSFISYGI